MSPLTAQSAFANGLECVTLGKSTNLSVRLLWDFAPMVARCLTVLIPFCLIGSSVTAQSTASSSLKQAYALSQNASTEAEYTSIIDIVRQASEAAADPSVAEYGNRLMAWALNRRGELRWDRKQSADDADGQAAIQDFQLSLKLDPKRWRAKQNMAFVHASQGEFEQAVAMMDTVIAIQPDHANAYFNRGELRYEMGKLDGAIADYTRALELMPGEADFLTSRAHARYQANQLTDAIADYQRAYELDSSNPSRAIDYADALQNVGRWRESQKIYQVAISLDAESIRARLNLAWLLATFPDSGPEHVAQSLRIIQSVREVPEHEQFRYLDTYAAGLAAHGEFAEAVRVAKSCLSLAPSSERVAFAKRLAGYEAGTPYRQPETRRAESPTASTRTENR